MDDHVCQIGLCLLKLAQRLVQALQRQTLLALLGYSRRRALEHLHLVLRHPKWTAQRLAQARRGLLTAGKCIDEGIHGHDVLGLYTCARPWQQQTLQQPFRLTTAVGTEDRVAGYSEADKLLGVREPERETIDHPDRLCQQRLTKEHNTTEDRMPGRR